MLARCLLCREVMDTELKEADHKTEGTENDPHPVGEIGDVCKLCEPLDDAFWTML